MLQALRKRGSGANGSPKASGAAAPVAKRQARPSGESERRQPSPPTKGAPDSGQVVSEPERLGGWAPSAGPRDSQPAASAFQAAVPRTRKTKTGMPLDSSFNPWKSFPGASRAAAMAQLAPGEQLIGWFETDLDAALHFATSFVLLTDRRILVSPAAGSEARDNGAGLAWPVSNSLVLRAREHAGVGSLELSTKEGRLALWRYTAGRSASAHRFVQRFDLVRRGKLDELDAWLESSSAVCPGCGGLIPPDETECPSCVPTAAPPIGSSLLRLARFARPRMGMALLGFVLSVACTAAGLVPPYITIPLVDNVLRPFETSGTPVDPWQVGMYLGLLGGAAVLAWLLDWARTYVLGWVSERVSADLRNTTYAHLQRLSLEFFGGKRTGDLISRIGSDTDRICYFLSVHLLDFGTDMLMLAMTASILMYIDFWLALATLIPLPLIAWLVTKVRRHLGHGFAQGGRAWAEMTSVLADTIPGVRVVKAFAQEQREIERFRVANQHILQTNDRVNATWAFFYPMVTLLTEVGLLVIWAAGVWRIVHHGATVGVLTGFVAYIGRFYVRLESISRFVASTQRAAASAHRIFEILDRVPSVAEAAQPFAVGHMRGAVEMRSVSFKYGTRSVVNGVNLSIRPGEMVGLVGPSGAGKSTLVNLVCRFYDVSEGAILVDGQDIRDLSIHDYRRNIGIVLQEPFLFYGTIAENIAYGRPHATREEIIAAARAAKAHEFILRLPDGYDSLVGERGQSLSGGERQRISIARALLIDPAILILDEATSAVDTETEREIQEALDTLIQGRTTIAIAHRLSTLRKADRIVVLERGKVVEVGKHDELLAHNGPYTRLHLAQMELAAGHVGAGNASLERPSLAP